MATAAVASRPISPPDSASSFERAEDEISLSPPQIRQPYTPPPQTGEEIEAERRKMRPLSSNGSIGVKEMRADGIDDLAICASPAQHRPRKGKRGGSESLAGMLRRGIVEHQLGLSLNLILLVGLSWSLFPSLRNKLESLFLLSYKTDQEGMYGQGPRDLYLVIAFVVFFTGVRAFTLDYVLMPLAGLLGIGRRKGRVR